MAGHTEAYVLINAPMDVVWDMTNDVASWPTLFTEYAKAEILASDGDTVRFRLTMHPDEDGTVRSWVSERTPDPTTRTVEAQRVEMGVFEFMKIFWSYEEADGGVLMTWTQDFAVRAEMPFDDEQMAAHLRKNTAVQMAHIKDRVEDVASGR